MTRNLLGEHVLLSRNTKKKRSQYIFVLWSDQFEELTATVFITQLREAGLRVKLVSLTRQRITGIHGVTLHPDFTLKEALSLASKAIGIIIPCGLRGTKQLENDPRLADFFGQAHKSGAQFVIGHQLNTTDNTDLQILLPQNDHLRTYPDDDEDLVGFARQIAISLSQVSG